MELNESRRVINSTRVDRTAELKWITLTLWSAIEHKEVREATNPGITFPTKEFFKMFAKRMSWSWEFGCCSEIEIVFEGEEGNEEGGDEWDFFSFIEKEIRVYWTFDFFADKNNNGLSPANFLDDFIVGITKCFNMWIPKENRKLKNTKREITLILSVKGCTFLEKFKSEVLK
jgi:hypothetical protein